ncbi:MAG: twin-arginine translocation signal domain-containing protein, partial [bacterium]|nr:twin-arginine translocation signal domain-containing protein [bacterium]
MTRTTRREFLRQSAAVGAAALTAAPLTQALAQAAKPGAKMR